MTYRQWEAIPEEDKHALLDELVENNGLLAHNDDGTFYVTELGEQYINARLAFAGGEIPANRWIGGEALNDLEAMAKRRLSDQEVEMVIEAATSDELHQALKEINAKLARFGVRIRAHIEEVQS